MVTGSAYSSTSRYPANPEKVVLDEALNTNAPMPLAWSHRTIVKSETIEEKTLLTEWLRSESIERACILSPKLDEKE